MAKEIVNNSTDIPFDEHSNFDERQELAGTDELDNLEPEEIAEILRKQNSTETPPQKVEEPNEEEDETEKALANALKDKDETSAETDDNVTEESKFALPDKLVGKTREEIAEMYINAEKLSSTHTEELGKLRKQKVELDIAKELAKKYEIEMSANKVAPTIKKWTKPEVADFIQKLGEDPQKAFASLINPYIKPLATSTAQTRNERMEEKLIAENKEKVVPYDRAEVNKVLEAKPELWKEHGTKAIQVAFNIYKEGAFDTRMEAKEKEFNEKMKEKQLNKNKEQATHVLGVPPAGRKEIGGNMQEAIAKLDKMDEDKALAILGKVLKYSN